MTYYAISTDNTGPLAPVHRAPYRKHNKPHISTGMILRQRAPLAGMKRRTNRSKYTPHVGKKQLART